MRLHLFWTPRHPIGLMTTFYTYLHPTPIGAAATGSGSIGIPNVTANVTANGAASRTVMGDGADWVRRRPLRGADDGAGRAVVGPLDQSRRSHAANQGIPYDIGLGRSLR